MSTNPLPDFPKKTRGTYRIKGDDDLSEAVRLDLAKQLILAIAERSEITILLDCKMQGGGWIMIWWPASEPRHQETDQIIN